MAFKVQNSFIRATKSKVVIVFLLACFALFVAWGISRFVFAEMLDTVEKLSTPNVRFRIVNELSRKISRLDQLQRDQAFNKVSNQNSFIKETSSLRKSLDTLAHLYAKDTRQLVRIQSLKKLLADRDKQFLKYLEVRETLVNTKSFSEEVKKLNELVSQKSRQVDSTVFTTATSTTTIAADEEEKSRGFLSRLFGKKKAEVYKIINEEFKIKRDTLNALAEDSIMRSIEGALQNIEQEQKQKSQKFLKREGELADASNSLTIQMLHILREVEAENLVQIERNGINAKNVVNEGVYQIATICIVFFLLTIILLYLILSDITKSNRYRKELEWARDEAEYHGKAKHRFLSNMSHEIRTPLQSILGYSELIASQAHPQKKDISAIHQSAIHLLQIVNEILDYNRIISGEFSFDAQPFDLIKLLKEVMGVMHPLALQKKIQLHADLPEEPHLTIVGDAFRLKQILFNLLGNAIKFTLKGSITLRVSYKKSEKDLHFSFVIEDTGIGFEEEHILRIFNEFEQIEIPQKNTINQAGTGLGLAIVKSLVENQSGRIHVKSKSGVGTTFTIYLAYPIADADVKTPIAKQETMHQIEEDVWVVDDDRLILDLCAAVFEGHQVPYQCFNTVDEVLSEEPPLTLKYVFIDIRMPKTSGIELHQVLKKKLPAAVKFYAITAQVLPDEVAHILAEGFTGVIKKPFSVEDLLAILKKENKHIEKPTLNLSILEKMTLGDEQLLLKLLNRFKEDCGVDMEQLKQYLDQNDQFNVHLLVHRLAGRIAQIGAQSLSMDFRRIEKEIELQTEIDVQQQQEILALLLKLEDLLELIENRN